MNSSIPKEPFLLADTCRGIAYSGFREGQHPDRGEGAVNPSRQEILEDLRLLSSKAGFSLIRLYDCGENSRMVLQLIQEEHLPLQVLLGIWLKAEVSNHKSCVWMDKPIAQEELEANQLENQAELQRGIQLAQSFEDIVAAVNVGNEALVEWNDHKVNTAEVISYVQQVKNRIKQPVTAAENYLWWVEQGASLAEVVDFLAIHTYAAWEGEDIDGAMYKTRKDIQAVQQRYPGKPLVITEAGWPSIAWEMGPRASEEKQARYYRELFQWAEEEQISTFFFEAFDEPWKGNPRKADGAEKHWGIYDVHRKPKKALL